MNCLVTAGPTFEPLDKVRRLTNFSTGRLGTELADFLDAQGHAVTFLLGEQATWRGKRSIEKTRHFSTTRDLSELLRGLAGDRMDAVFHAAAVSDFAFGGLWQKTSDGNLRAITASKISSRLENLFVELVPAVKIIARLREWFPQACLVGWKFEVEGDSTAAVALAKRQITENRTDACVANGPGYGPGYGLITADRQHQHLSDFPALFAALENLALAVRTNGPRD